jgi:hypothetical protein
LNRIHFGRSDITILEEPLHVENDLGDNGPEPLVPETLASAELAECTCPEFCERDHGNE